MGGCPGHRIHRLQELAWRGCGAQLAVASFQGLCASAVLRRESLPGRSMGGLCNRPHLGDKEGKCQGSCGAGTGVGHLQHRSKGGIAPLGSSKGTSPALQWSCVAVLVTVEI